MSRERARPSVLISGYVCQVHSGGDGSPSPDQRLGIWIHGGGHWKRIRGAHAHQRRVSLLFSTSMSIHLTISAPTQDQVERAKALAEDLLQVLRIEYEKARNGGNAGGQAGVYQAGYGTYAPAAGGADPYAAYYVSDPPSPLCVTTHTQGNGTPGQQGSATPAAGAAAGASAGGAPPAGQIPQQGTEAWQQYAAYWAAYGYDVNDPQCTLFSCHSTATRRADTAVQAWQQSQLQQGGQASAA